MIEQQLFEVPVSKKTERKPKPGCPRCGNQMEPYKLRDVVNVILTKTGRIKQVVQDKPLRKPIQPAEVRIGTKDVKVCGKCVYELGRLV